ncbi:ABC transporter ATP-binding protein [Erysipelothrix sp. HDW6C]|uniref:ABC transporter ATP-binding protein n=1 Tax=Erysipelothrix sp. HDW6C TaxID=2714930 RepID=UPI00140A6072|nr:ABC transporter ATP-binding protein [Erysipelothrix sp. HDW6C]QIK70483.1 ABC transporter ATP-binding protein [Erysipelothrix sp. HDW6C]
MSQQSLVIGKHKPKDQKGTLLRLLSYLGESKFLLIVVIIASIVSTLGGLYGSYAISPLIATIEQGMNNTITREVMFSSLTTQLIGLAIIFAIEVGAMFLAARLMVKISQRTVETIRKEMFSHVLRMKVSYHDANAHGDLMSRFTNDIDLVGEGLNTAAASIVINIFTLIGTVVVMFILSPILTAVTMIILPLLSLMSNVIIKKSRIYSKRQQQSLGDLNGYVEESMEGQVVMQLFNHEEKAREKFQKKNQVYRKNSQFAQITSIMIYPLMQNINTISYAVIGIVGGYLAINGRLSIGDLGAYVNMTRTQGKPINEISSQFTTLQSAIASAERIFELLDWKEEEIRDTDLVLDTVEGDVRFEDVTFGYVKNVTVLKDVTFWAAPGQKIAFVGSTGAGKTTITNLISRFYDINSGKILIDGHDISKINRLSLRKHIAMVLQDTNLFTGTIMENIRYGNLDATDEECIAAAKLANAHHFIRTLEHGYDTEISGTGSELSQGQKQLLNIARAAVANPSILILDEATSSIDTRTERLIEQGMDSLMKGRTTFIIAHRLSTVRNSDAIIVLEHGRIIERGSHDELVEQGGRYASLYSGQTELS